MTKQDPTVKIASGDYFKAQRRWASFWGDEQAIIPSFSNFLGMTGDLKLRAKSTSSLNYVIHIRRSAAKKIAMLNGPHHYALLKAYQIKKLVK